MKLSALRSLALRLIAKATTSFCTLSLAGVSRINFINSEIASVKVNNDLDLSSILKWYNSFNTFVRCVSSVNKETNLGINEHFTICACMLLLNEKLISNKREVE